ncbi:hypothetical protein [Amycolatopsis regifaucium]|uniref:DUF5666 domain-containing protein n=1 Tax=Amycolatopsis regifaucium TaxID=546365 RepID=A0A154MP93_9PSEU|nr:hypothetical protein [Amycolatopsis regifaucium]KZB85239.1 hypothetical protein AVL48_03370 [Amycolatopsis regifaucium]OKA03783.1 hypothetical protein ATP06_0234255 [Amycolatopsis regifaucium]SFH89314.1 hypothetical protein SAMN04489731_10711 [Amycolatopsis regifaucium]
MTEPTKPGEPAGPTEPATGETAAWGAPVPPRTPKKTWSGRKTAVAAGVAVVLAAGGGAAIWAGTVANGAERAQGGMMGGPGGGRVMIGPGGGMPRDTLHGDFVVPDGKGGYHTERVQTGEITEISATSVSLTSKDGYKQVYTIDASTRKTGDPKTGETVTVTAKVSGQTATATTIGKAGQNQRGQTGGQPGQGQQGQPGQGGPRPGY